MGVVCTMYPPISDVMRVCNHKLKTFAKRLLEDTYDDTVVSSVQI